jgi:hypothetical protein
LEADVARLKARGNLHPDVQVRSVLFSLDAQSGRRRSLDSTHPMLVAWTSSQR